MAGQSWTVHNVGKRIMFGGEYITYMGPSAPVSDKTYPPYQSARNRVYVNNTHSAVLSEFSRAGGLNYYAGIQQASYSATPGGYWTDRRGLGISWRNSTVYMNGKYGNLDTLPFSSVVINATVYIDPAESYEAIIIAVCYDTISPYEVSFRRYGVAGLTGSGETLTLTRIDKPTDIPSMYPYYSGSEYQSAEKGVTTFTSTTRSIAYLTPVSGTTQVIMLRTYNSDYTAYVDNEILRRNLYTVTTGAVASITAGDSQVVRIQTEGDSFGLISTNIVSYTQTYASTGSSSTNAAGSYASSLSSEFSYSVELLKPDGTATVVSPNFATSTDDQWLNMSYTRINPSGSNWFFTSCIRDDSEVYSAVMVLGYSATRAVVSYLKFGFSNVVYYSGSQPPPLYISEATETKTESRSCSLHVNTEALHTFTPYNFSEVSTNPNGSHATGMPGVLTDIVNSVPPTTLTSTITFGVFYTLFSSAHTKDFLVVTTTGDGFYPLTNVKFTLYLNLRNVSDYNLIIGSSIAYNSGNTEYLGLTVAPLPYTLTTRATVPL